MIKRITNRNRPTLTALVFMYADQAGQVALAPNPALPTDQPLRGSWRYTVMQQASWYAVVGTTQSCNRQVGIRQLAQRSHVIGKLVFVSLHNTTIQQASWCSLACTTQSCNRQAGICQLAQRSHAIDKLAFVSLHNAIMQQVRWCSLVCTMQSYNRQIVIRQFAQHNHIMKKLPPHNMSYKL